MPLFAIDFDCAYEKKEEDDTISISKTAFYDIIDELEATPITSGKQEKALQTLIDKLEALVVNEDDKEGMSWEDVKETGRWKNPNFERYKK